MSNSKNLYQRINEVRKEVSYIQKEKKSSLQYAVVSHDDVTAKLRPSLITHGIVVLPVRMQSRQDGNRTEMQVDIRFQNVDDKDDFMDIPSLGYGIDSQDKGPGKAISYAFKMALLKVFSLETGMGEEVDFDQKSEHEPSPAGQKKNMFAA